MDQIRLSNASFEGDNNVYLLDDGPETVLIDSGDWMTETREQLAAALDKQGVSFGEIDRIFLTHWHGDHVGQAHHIQDVSGAEVYIHEADAPLIEGDETAWEEMGETQRRLFDHWGMPDQEQQVLEDIFASVPYQDNPVDITPIQDGETFTVNDRTIRVVHAPGHAAGLSLYETTLDGHDDAFTGDALLPQYTPNVGGADVRVERPLESYLETLQHIATADYDHAWPGHRDVIADPSARAEYIIHHHEERAWRVLDALSQLGPSTTWEVSATLFGELEHIHILHGPGESYAHLTHLEREGLVVCEGDQYRLADGVETELEQREEEYWPLR